MNTRFDAELSRLAFEDRLIEFCEDEQTPLLDRIRLLGIVGERIDVFFMTRVGRLKRLLAEERDQRRTHHAPPHEQLAIITVEANRIMRRAYGLVDHLLRQLEEKGAGIDRWESIGDDDREHLRHICGRKLDALVNPIIVENDRSFPHVRNLRPALLASARRKGEPCNVVVELPADLPRLVPLQRRNRFVPLEQIIAAELPTLCRDIEVVESHLFRVTRNGSTEIDDYDDVRDIEEEIVQRPFQEVIRLEVDAAMPAEMRERLQYEFAREEDTPPFALGEQDTYTVQGLVDLTGLEDLAKVDLPALKSAPMKQRATQAEQILESTSPDDDILLHFPYDDYETSIERLLHAAARHPELESIQTTIYRTDRNSDTVAALRAARGRGADATAVVELKASFDERDNIELSRSLEADGVRVVLSPASLKVHAKTALITFREGHTPRRVALFGTGNMNAVTSRTYIDLWLVTRDPKRTNELALLFDIITGERPPEGARFDNLIVSPFEMRGRFLELIERETGHAMAGRPSGIRALMNGLTDSAVMAALYRASQAGVPIELMVRGPCLLRPGAPGISDNISIISIAGLLLQHARIYSFRNGGADAWYIGSADWRPRNFDVRVETITPVDRPHHVAVLERVLTETLATPDAWELREDGVYVRRSGKRRASAA